jgi:hypothetical protein
MAADGNTPEIRELYGRAVVLEMMLTHVLLVLVSSAGERSRDAVGNLLLPVERSLKGARDRATTETEQAAQDALDYFSDYSERLKAALPPVMRAPQ